MKKYIVLLLLLLPVAGMAATAGVWEGTLKTPKGDMGLVVNLHADGSHWAGEVDIPMQGISELPLNNVKVEGATVSFALPGPGDPHFDGKLSEDGKTIAGDFSQGGGSIPLELKWKSEARAAAKTQPNSGEVAVLEGVWDGTLNANGTSLRLRFHFTKNADGSITGTFDSLDQGANGLPVSSISRQGDAVKLDLKTVSGSYEGTLNKEATTLTGTFTQGGANLPLTLERKKSEAK
jgi:hypothetical protein